jgi:hypothetical protein
VEGKAPDAEAKKMSKTLPETRGEVPKAAKVETTSPRKDPDTRIKKLSETLPETKGEALTVAKVETPAPETVDDPASLPPLAPPSAAPSSDTTCTIYSDWLASLDVKAMESLEKDLWTLAGKFGLPEARLECPSIILSAHNQDNLRDAKQELVNGILEFYKPREASADKRGQHSREHPRKVHKADAASVDKTGRHLDEVDAPKDCKREDADKTSRHWDEVDAAKGHRRQDPSDGSLWAWPEFKTKYELEFGLEATTEYWNSMPLHHEAGQHTAAEQEARRDPADGSPWTWTEFKARYEDKYGLEATSKYWKAMPLSTEVRAPPRPAGGQCHVRHRW